MYTKIWILNFKNYTMLNLNRSNFQARRSHLVSPSPWPLYASISLLTITIITITIFAMLYLDIFSYPEFHVDLSQFMGDYVTLGEDNELQAVPGRRCPTCLERGDTVWVIPGNCCPECETPVR